uniref:hypothetical protein n=1 Tax=Flavobacterium sp. TaxID=239 RepID=UPI0040496704
MVKRFIVLLGILITCFSHAQNGSSSPYSFYGIGDVRFKGGFENRNMGGLSIYADSIHLNFQNPAANSALRLTTFTVGGSNNWNRIESNSGSQQVQRTSIDYLAVGLPLGKLGANFGVMPFSSVGYRNRNVFTEDDEEKTNIFEGDGGVNRVFLSFGYEINKALSVGLTMNYDFGSIETRSSEYFTGIETGSEELDNSTITGFVANFGLIYKKPVTEKLTGYGSFTFSPEARLNTTNTRTLSTVSFSSNFGNLVVDSQSIDVPDETIVLPSKISFGAGLGQTNIWMAGAQFTTQLSSNFGNRFSDLLNTSYEPAYHLSVGGFYVPKFNSFRSYFSRVTYRAGFRYENTGLKIQNESITDFGTNFGLGLPIGGAFSKLNVGLEIGKRGTLNQNLVKENYYNLTIGITINDKWFQKIKYD